LTGHGIRCNKPSAIYCRSHPHENSHC
jgi:hypothetical protein